ncbi:mitochondrial fission ELM1 family protein [Muricoccus radiodurans]|uniref:mitochondrial fission ELM1 family protein n=1 Tax=Muricoccus radiodurans TaxID=2231721 RepID=UPI003CFB2EB1
MSGGERVWVLADPRAGTAAQAIGIAERLGEPFRTIPLEWGPLARLPIPWPSLAGLTPPARDALLAGAMEGRPAVPPGARPRVLSRWPDLVISAGRRSGPVSRWLRRRGARTVHCMRPGSGAADFDLLVIGRHDAPAPAPNVLPILGACHRLSPARLEAARAEFPALADLPAPRVALLVGGPVRGEGMPPNKADRLMSDVLRRYPSAGLMLTTSRRTGEAATAVIAAALAGRAHRLFRWGEAGANPYAGFLAWADAVVVTGDSVSMLSEACATAVPVLVATQEAGRHAALVQSLYDAGQAWPLSGVPGNVARQPLDESGRVAGEIVARGWLADAGGT